MKKLFIVGSTGSIGTQTLDIVRMYRDKFTVVGMSAFGNDIELFAKQIVEFGVSIVGLYDSTKVILLKNLIKKYQLQQVSASVDTNGSGINNKLMPLIYLEQDSLIICGSVDVDQVVVACGGMIALKSVVSAIQGRKNIALSNKECLVACGKAVMELAQHSNIKISPIDSEHSAIAQCLSVDNIDRVRRLILTASGGSYYDYTQEKLKTITVKEALKHPNWQMGAKITVDSATMMNKALEIIEARWLYNTTKVDYCIHPNSIIHSMVEYIDGSIITHMSKPTMHIPIMLAISETRLELNVAPLEFDTLNLEFRSKNEEVFVAPKIAKQLIENNNMLPCVFNSSNEIAVQMFLDGRIGFDGIMHIISKALDKYSSDSTIPDIYNVWEYDNEVKARINEYL